MNAENSTLRLLVDNTAVRTVADRAPQVPVDSAKVRAVVRALQVLAAVSALRVLADDVLRVPTDLTNLIEKVLKPSTRKCQKNPRTRT